MHLRNSQWLHFDGTHDLTLAGENWHDEKRLNALLSLLLMLLVPDGIFATSIVCFGSLTS